MANQLEPFVWLRTGHPRWKYRVTENYRHPLRFRMKVNKERASQYLGFYHVPTEDKAIILRCGYAWNGSNVVADTATDMRASAVHDAQSQAMGLGIYEPTLKNWRRAASEYRHNCMVDGMTTTRAFVRYTGILIGGGNSFKWRGSLKRKVSK